MTLSVQKVREQDAVIDFKATLASSEYEHELTTWLNKKSQTAKIDGFRPGKAPITVIKKLYADEASRSVTNLLIDRVLKTIGKEHQIRVAGHPNVSIEKADATQGFECNVSVECLPEIELKDFSEISCEELVIDISKKEVDEAVERLFKSYKGHEQEPKKSASEWGDKVSFILNEKSSVHKDQKQDLVLEEKLEHKVWTNLHKGLHGKAAGDKTQIVIEYPDDFEEKSIAGQSFTYDIKIEAVYSPLKFTLDDTFAKEFGCDTLEALHDKLKTTMENDQNRLISLYHKRQVLDALNEQYNLNLPKSSVESEFKQIWGRLQEEINAAKARGEKEDINLHEVEIEYRQIAARRVKLGLIVSEIASKNTISLSNEDIQKELTREALKYPNQFNEVVDLYIKNPRLLEKLVAPALEDKVVDFVLSKAKKKQTKITTKDMPAKLKGIVPGYEDEDQALEASDKKATKTQKESKSDSEKAPAKKASTKKKGE